MATITVKDAGGTTQTVSTLPANDGTSLPVTATALPLPTGAATAAGQTATTAAINALAPYLDGLEALLGPAATASLQSALNALVGTTTPSSAFYAVTPSDSADLATLPKALYVSAAGTLAVQNGAGTTVSFGNVLAGSILPIQAKRVMATGTSATVVALA